MSNRDKVIEPYRPNESGSTQCIVRWLVDTPGGWIGAYDKEAFDAYKADAILAKLAESAELVHMWRRAGCADWYRGFPDDEDGGGPYERATYYAVPIDAQAQIDELQAELAKRAARIEALTKALRTIADGGRMYSQIRSRLSDTQMADIAAAAIAQEQS